MERMKWYLKTMFVNFPEQNEFENWWNKHTNLFCVIVGEVFFVETKIKMIEGAKECLH